MHLNPRGYSIPEPVSRGGTLVCLPVGPEGCSQSHQNHRLRMRGDKGTWVAQLVEHLMSAQVMISQFVSLSPTSGSVPTAQSLEPASDPMSPSLSALPLLTLWPPL